MDNKIVKVLYSDILETKEQIEARLNKHDMVAEKNRAMAEKNRQEWANRQKNLNNSNG